MKAEILILPGVKKKVLPLVLGSGGRSLIPQGQLALNKY